MADDALEKEIEKTRSEIEGHRERLEELEAQRQEQRAEEVDLETLEDMTAEERRDFRGEFPARWRRLMEEKRDRALRRLEKTNSGRF